ncbi:hypothetical protein SPFL3102_00236 [Sporomusaceae bacterium FL31]|nr:hypothetical protein SPFL3101_01728 [Sporomusaceae bacterium FL31]GCE32458.1 hypothetical protein SPFL3102_00236 [Sporomusaceae bacterium]
MKALLRGDKKHFNENDTMQFLLMEYDKCFEQLRHYDSIQNSVIVIGITGYIGVYSGLYAIYQGSFDTQVKVWIANFTVFMSFLIGLLLIDFIVKNRDYFARNARQLNSIRNYVLSNSEIDFIKYNKHHINSNYPLSLSYSSTSYIFVMFLCLLNASLVWSGDIIYLQLQYNLPVYTALCSGAKWGGITFILELCISTWILSRKDKQ